MGEFCPIVVLHREGSAYSACAAALFLYLSTSISIYLYLSFSELTFSGSTDIVTGSQGIHVIPSLHFVQGDLFKGFDFSLSVPLSKCVYLYLFSLFIFEHHVRCSLSNSIPQIFKQNSPFKVGVRDK